MFTTTLTALAAAAALHGQTVAANPVVAQAAPTTVASPQVTAISSVPKAENRVRIPGTFATSDTQDLLDGVHALYLVRSGDGA